MIKIYKVLQMLEESESFSLTFKSTQKLLENGISCKQTTSSLPIM